jgi:inorganic pyrophosphatase
MSLHGYSIKEVAKPETLEYRVFFQHNGKAISPFHDIPLWADKANSIAHMVVEIPKGTQPKLEISKDNFLNPIKQDVKNGKLRNVAWKYPFNYGALPQTWENPAFVHPDTKAKGDNDPVDAVELSSSAAKTGDVKKVKVLGTYAMIDEGETDWKVVVIDVTDPVADKLNDVEDIEKHLPGKLKEVFEFLRDYKIPDGKPANNFGFNGELKNKKFAIEVIEETYKEWKALIEDPASKIQTGNTTNHGSKFFLSSEEAEKNLGH